MSFDECEPDAQGAPDPVNRRQHQQYGGVSESKKRNENAKPTDPSPPLNEINNLRSDCRNNHMKTKKALNETQRQSEGEVIFPHKPRTTILKLRKQSGEMKTMGRGQTESGR